MERRGVPSVVVATEPFIALVQARLRSLGLHGVPLLVLPHPFETKHREEIRAIARQRVDELLTLLTWRYSTWRGDAH
jgi:hypothetical protein